MTIPTDSFMLMSFVNTKLRDDYDTLDDMCQSMDIDKEELVRRLSDAGFEYNAELKKFW